MKICTRLHYRPKQTIFVVQWLTTHNTLRPSLTHNTLRPAYLPSHMKHYDPPTFPQTRHITCYLPSHITHYDPPTFPRTWHIMTHLLSLAHDTLRPVCFPLHMIHCNPLHYLTHGILRPVCFPPYITHCDPSAFLRTWHAVICIHPLAHDTLRPSYILLHMAHYLLPSLTHDTLRTSPIPFFLYL